MSFRSALERFLGSSVRVALARERPLVIAVAGSVGKTSTKTAIGIALGAHEEESGVIATKKNYNNELGVPLTVLGCDAPGRSPLAWVTLLGKALCVRIGVCHLPARVYVLEMGTDHPGDLAYLTSIAPPHLSVLTAIGPEHTEFFGSVEAVAGEEISILHALRDEGVAVLNADDDVIRTLAAPLKIQTYTFGVAEDATSRIVDHRLVIEEGYPQASGIEIRLSLIGTTRTIRLNGTVGRPQAYAVAAALAVVNAVDGDEALALERLEHAFFGMPGRMRLIEGIKHTWLIDDSYNSSPLAALSALRDLSDFPVQPGCRRIAALGDMLELGSLAESSHRQVGRAAVESGVDLLVVCGSFAGVVAEAAKAAGMSDDAVFTFPESREAGRFIQDRMKKGDVVLIKGSQGARMERIAKELMAHPEKAEDLLVRHTKDWLKGEV